MRIEKEKISATQFMFSVACFIQASSLLSSFLTPVTAQDSWLVVLIGFVLCLPLMWLYLKLMALFPDQNLLQILSLVYGPVAGKIIGLLYAWFFITLTSLNSLDMGSLVNLTLMVETPSVVLMLMCILVSAWAIRYGIKVVTRYGSLFVLISGGIVVASVLLVFNQVNFQNFLPMFDQPIAKYVQGTHIIMTIPFGELVAFLMIAPNIRPARQGTAKYLLWGFALGGVTILMVVMRDIAVLGNTINLFALPSLVTLRLVNLGQALSRMEVLFVIVLIILLFFKIMLLYYISVITIAQLLNMKAYRHIVLAVGALVVAYALTLYPSSVAHAASGRETTPVIWTPLEILLPLLTFVIAKLRKLPKAREV